VAVPPHAGVLRASVAGEFAVAVTRRDKHLAEHFRTCRRAAGWGFNSFPQRSLAFSFLNSDDPFPSSLTTLSPLSLCPIGIGHARPVLLFLLPLLRQQESKKLVWKLHHSTLYKLAWIIIFSANQNHCHRVPFFCHLFLSVNPSKPHKRSARPDLSTWDPQGSSLARLLVVGPDLAHCPTEEA
jgi:hypothetical protein